MDGRWTINEYGSVYEWHEAQPVPVVPCDDAAIERAARAIRENRAWLFTPREIVELVLRAAGETP